MEDYYLKQVRKAKIVAIIALLFGILGILMTCCCGLGIIFGVISVLLSLCSILVEFRGNNIVIASLVMGILSIILGLGVPLIYIGLKVDDWKGFIFMILDIIFDITDYLFYL